MSGADQQPPDFVKNGNVGDSVAKPWAGEVQLSGWVSGHTYDPLIDALKEYAVRTAATYRDGAVWFIAETASKHQVHRVEICLKPQLEQKTTETGVTFQKPHILVTLYEDGGPLYGKWKWDDTLPQLLHEMMDYHGELEDTDELGGDKK